MTRAGPDFRPDIDDLVIAICGSRGWKKADPISVLIAGYMVLAEGSYRRLVVVHGDEKGADKLADSLGQQWGALVVPVPARWDDPFPNSASTTRRMGKAAGPIRNTFMLKTYSPEAVYAYRATGKSNGTDDMVRQAKKAGIPVFVTTDPTLEEDDDE